MAASTQRALADRAVRLASRVEELREEVHAQINAQNIDYHGQDSVAVPVEIFNRIFSFTTPLVVEIRRLQRSLDAERKRGQSRSTE